MSEPVVLAIGGSDPLGHSGVQQDLASFRLAGVRSSSVITAVTVQQPSRVVRIDPVDPALVAEQIGAVLAAGDVRAAKTGMLPTAACVEAVAGALGGGQPLVVDPVLASTGGDALVDGDVVEALIATLIPRAALVTPNADEAARISGLPVADEREQKRAAEWFLERGASACVVTGGHLAGVDVVDLYVLRDGTAGTIRMPRLPGGPVRGTGCRFSATVAACLATGRSVVEAIEHGVRAVRIGIEGATDIGQGMRGLGSRAGGRSGGD